MKYLFIFLFLMTPFSTFASLESDSCETKEQLRIKLDIISSNIANLNTTRTPEGGPYLKKELVCVEQECEVIELSSTFKKYEPSHPDADEYGFVSYPDIDLMQEMKSMIQTIHDYDEATKICQ